MAILQSFKNSLITCFSIFLIFVASPPLANSQDTDGDNILDEFDNCLEVPNGPDAGTCSTGQTGTPCTIPGLNESECGMEGFCSMNQEDTYPPGGNSIGDACDCESDFNCDGDVDSFDITLFLADFGRGVYLDPCKSGNPCNGDFICDGDVDSFDITTFLEDFGRGFYDRPCPACVVGEWCGDSVLTISGFVSGNGLPLIGAEVQIGTATVQTSTNVSGNFIVQVGSNDLLDRADGTVFPIKITALGFATGYVNVPFEMDRTVYPNVEIKLLAVSDEISSEENVTQGVDINKEGEKVGELTIPAGSFPAGVTQITGSVTYIDPTTPDINSFPGSDFMAAPEGGGEPVLLESIGVMEFDLKDQDGNEISELNGEATVCMKVPDGLEVSAGDTIPLWHYDPDAGLWVEEGEGTVEDRGAEGFWICGGVNHFTWWNYDTPIETHACFKFQFANEITGLPINYQMWYAEGITYTGSSTERPCACDNDDPTPPCPSDISSFTVKKSDDPPAEPERIRIYTTIDGKNYYLIDDGDGTFSLTLDAPQATEFTTPSVQASCIQNVNVSGCQLLDGEDGILPFSAGFNRAPIISSLVPNPNSVDPGGTSSLEAIVIDPDDDDFTVSWSAMCGGVVAAGSTPTNFAATFTAPVEQTICQVTLEATDTHGNSSSASGYIGVGLGGECEIHGTIYGPNGAPLVGATLSLQGGDSCTGNESLYSQEITTGLDGSYLFTEIPCCQVCQGNPYIPYILAPFVGWLQGEFQFEGTTWNHALPPILLAGCNLDGSGSDSCTQNIFLPTVWDSLQGTVYAEDGTPDTSIESMQILSLGNFYSNFSSGYQVAEATVPVVNGIYSVSVPVGEGFLHGLNNNLSRGYQVLFKDQNLTADSGPGAKGSISGTVYNDQSAPISNVEVCINAPSGVGGVYPCTTTDGNGYYIFSNLPVGRETGFGFGQYLIFVENVPVAVANINVKDETVTVDINGPGVTTVTGVLYSMTGLPVGGVEIQLYDQLQQSPPMSAWTGVGGVFTFEGVPGGIYSLSANNLFYDPITGLPVIAVRMWLPVNVVGQEVTVDLIAVPNFTSGCIFPY